VNDSCDDHANGNKNFHEEFDRAEEVKREPPRPLTREIPVGEQFPVDALGPVMAAAAEAIQRRVQAPLAICAQSVLSVAALAVQPFCDVVLPIGESGIRPLSLYLMTIAESGERKTSADDLALGPLRDHERGLGVAYDEAKRAYACDYAAWKQQHQQILTSKDYPDRDSKRVALEGLGDAPSAPWFAMRTCNEPTFEGLVRFFDEGWPTAGLFSDEGGQFVGGHAMSEDNRLKSAAAFSDLWAGKPIRRVRAGTGLQIFPGRRLSVHLMVQPIVAQRFFGDPLLRDQGLHSRFLTSMPASTQGTRQSGDQDPNFSDFSHFSGVVTSILGRDLPLGQGKELRPRPLPFSETAAQLWHKYSNGVESQLGPNGSRELIKGLANKLPEHAARIAGILTLIEDIEAVEIDHFSLARGIELTEYYASEAVRIYSYARVRRELALAQKLYDWLKLWGSKNDNLVSLPDIYQKGPNQIADKAAASRLVGILQEHGLLQKLDGPAEVAGKPRREVWRIIA
jgi:Protein of unknown function (DUF3987)